VVECCDVISDRVDGSHPRGVVGGTVKCCDGISAVTELMVATQDVWLEVYICVANVSTRVCTHVSIYHHPCV
jgi:hypothetical protein